MTVPLNPTQFDKAAQEYLAIKEQVFNAKLALRELEQQLETKGELIKIEVENFGGAHRDKSKISHGLKYEAVVTFAQEIRQDAAAIEVFRAALKTADQSRLLNKLFDKSIRWTLNPQASEIIRGTKLSSKLQALWANCIVLKDRNPSLQVREKAA